MLKLKSLFELKLSLNFQLMSRNIYVGNVLLCLIDRQIYI